MTPLSPAAAIRLTIEFVPDGLSRTLAGLTISTVLPAGKPTDGLADGVGVTLGVGSGLGTGVGI